MFNQKMWQIARHLFDQQNTKQSLNIGIGAGVAILATGSGVLPALMAASFASAGATTLRALWDEYKKKNEKPTWEAISVKWKETIEPASGDIALVKASSYNNFLDTLKSAAKGNAGMGHVSWIEALSDKIDQAIRVSTQRSEGVETLVYLKEQTRTFAERHVLIVATNTFVQAMDRPVKNDLRHIADAVNSLGNAIRANGLLIKMNPGGDTADNERLHNWRVEHLKNKFDVVKKTFESGISTDVQEPDNLKMQLEHIVERIGRMQGQLFPVSPVIVAQPAAPEPWPQVIERQQAKDKLYNAWNASFDNVGANMSNAVSKLDAFQKTLFAHSDKNGADEASMLLAEQLYDRLAMAQGFQGGDTHMFVQLENLKQSTQAFIQVHASNVAQKAIVAMERKPEIVGDYDNAMGQTIATRDAARLQATAARFAPEASDEISAKRIVDNLDRIKSAIVLGMDESTGSKIINSFLTTPEAINQEIGQADNAVETMRERMQEAQPKLDNLVALG